MALYKLNYLLIITADFNNYNQMSILRYYLTHILGEVAWLKIKYPIDSQFILNLLKIR